MDKRRGNPDKITSHQFRPGHSGNPGGRPKRTPYTDACRQVAEMCVRDLKVNASDPVPLAIAKMVAREALRGKVQAAAELANRIEGTPTQRHELGGPDGLAMKVEAKVSIGDLFGAIRTIYGLEEEAK